jgi:hypothetical protein
VVKNEARLEVRVGGQEIRSRRLAHVQPSEMIRLSLEKDAVSAEDGGHKSTGTGGAVMEVSIR